MRWLLMILALLATPAAASTRGPLVLAAASMQDALGAAADRWAARGHARPVLSFAASSALARQVQAGGAADLFVSADEEWMDVLARGGLIVAGTRADLVGNRLVVVAPLTFRGRLTRATLGRVLARGPVAMADPAAVPAGRYGRAALERLGAWGAVAPRVVRAENVRAALALVERGAAPFGIVYLTDVRSSARVRVAGLFPADSHPPIRYPVARLTASTHRDAEGFRRFLLSREGLAVFARFGFTRP
ncbi:molybdate ABC transporter substrate-binding protein [Sphingomonas sp.]|jgi:molybdate transport system substrate-binding protein|uniref:molybdate ABC transporter substrate-binding protein n=1 Tax=Sphingomonas sp. TaxID=28214 RepID=UPI002D7F72D6|nr:molybdate ABC transporter substrate-binding protein [Sphingomonas sp.]HEU0044955.1 molybdate ABC transporter substrate-binding protein [Sphingomonas sp.]